MLNKKKIPIYLLSLVPLAHIIKGILPFDVTLIVYILLFFFSLYWLIVKRIDFIFSKIDILFYVWTLLMLIGIIYSPYQSAGFIKIMKFIFLSLSLIFFTRLFIKNKEEISLLINYLVLNSTLLSYIVIVDYFFSGMEITRYVAFGTINQIPLSLLGSVTLLISIFFLYYKRINYVVFSIIIFPAISIMAIAGSKGPVVSLICTLILLAPIYLKKIRMKFVLFIFVTFFSLTRIQFVRDALELLISRFITVGNDVTTTNRLRIYENTISIIKKNPFLGAGTEISYPSYPHNFFLEVISENGLLLLLVILCLLVIFANYFFKCINKKNNDYIEIIVLSLIIISFITLMFSYSYVDHKYFFLSIGLLITYYKVNKAELK